MPRVRPDIEIIRNDGDVPPGVVTGVQRRCPNGHGFHPKALPCPECGNTPKFNKGLRTAALNAHLYEMAERA